MRSYSWDGLKRKIVFHNCAGCGPQSAYFVGGDPRQKSDEPELLEQSGDPERRGDKQLKMSLFKS